MTKIIGRQNAVAISKETTRGTQPSSVGYFLPWTEIDIDTKVDIVHDETAYARLEGTDASAVVGKYVEGKIKSKMKGTSFGLLLLSLFGTDTPAAQSAPNAAVYDHVFSVAQSTAHQSLTIGLKGSNDDVVSKNSVIDSMKLSAELGQYVMFEAGFIGQALAAASPSLGTVSFSQEKDFVPQNVTFKKATAQSGLTGASAINIRSFSIEFKQNLIKEMVLGNVAPNDILNQSFEVSGTIKLVHTDATYADLQNNETNNAFRIDITNADTIGTSANTKLRIDLYKCRVFNYSRKQTLNDLVEESFDFKAHYSLTDSLMLAVTLSNLVTAY